MKMFVLQYIVCPTLQDEDNRTTQYNEIIKSCGSGKLLLTVRLLL